MIPEANPLFQRCFTQPTLEIILNEVNSRSRLWKFQNGIWNANKAEQVSQNHLEHLLHKSNQTYVPTFVNHIFHLIRMHGLVSLTANLDKNTNDISQLTAIATPNFEDDFCHAEFDVDEVIIPKIEKTPRGRYKNVVIKTTWEKTNTETYFYIPIDFLDGNQLRELQHTKHISIEYSFISTLEFPQKNGRFALQIEEDSAIFDGEESDKQLWYNKTQYPSAEDPRCILPIINPFDNKRTLCGFDQNFYDFKSFLCGADSSHHYVECNSLKADSNFTYKGTLLFESELTIKGVFPFFAAPDNYNQNSKPINNPQIEIKPKNPILQSQSI